MKKKVLIISFSLIAIILSGCSSDSDESQVEDRSREVVYRQLEDMEGVESRKKVLREEVLVDRDPAFKIYRTENYRGLTADIKIYEEDQYRYFVYENIPGAEIAVRTLTGDFEPHSDVENEEVILAKLAEKRRNEKYQSKIKRDDKSDGSVRISDTPLGYLETVGGGDLRGGYIEVVAASHGLEGYLESVDGSSLKSGYLDMVDANSQREGYLETVKSGKLNSGYLAMVDLSLDREGYLENIDSISLSDGYLSSINSDVQRGSGYLDYVAEKELGDGYIDLVNASHGPEGYLENVGGGERELGYLEIVEVEDVQDGYLANLNIMHIQQDGYLENVAGGKLEGGYLEQVYGPTISTGGYLEATRNYNIVGSTYVDVVGNKIPSQEGYLESQGYVY